jgi:hypothetical protein
VGVLQVRGFHNLVQTAAFLCGCCLTAGQTIKYHLEAAWPLSRFTPHQLALLMKVNHSDSAHLAHLKRILVPDCWNLEELLYSPMPYTLEQLSNESKAIVVDVAAQTFGAYEHGILARWGPVSSGDRRHQTPSGTYHLNWHARVRISSENATWVMPWYFNFSNNLGLGFHQYILPGRPASHGCIRMLKADAEWLFQWGESGILATGGPEIARSGTVVLVLGKYDFQSAPPGFARHGGIKS